MKRDHRDMDTRFCKSCREWVEPQEMSEGYDCLKCEKIRRGLTLQKYGLTVDEYQVILEQQDGCCAICGLPAEQHGKRKGSLMPLCVDHCHTSGEIRGLLCNNCNIGIGMLKDSIPTLKKAISYLKK